MPRPLTVWTWTSDTPTPAVGGGQPTRIQHLNRSNALSHFMLLFALLSYSILKRSIGQ